MVQACSAVICYYCIRLIVKHLQVLCLISNISKLSSFRSISGTGYIFQNSPKMHMLYTLQVFLYLMLYTRFGSIGGVPVKTHSLRWSLCKPRST